MGGARRPVRPQATPPPLIAFRIRDAAPADVAALAQLWFDAWRDAHAAILPPAWARARTLDSFAVRLAGALDRIRVADGADGPLGFAMVTDDELDQFFLAAAARGTGLADALMADALDRLRAAGVTTAWLACAVGNARAARFYERQGWRRAGTIRRELATPNGPVGADVWRYEIDLRPMAHRSEDGDGSSAMPR